MIVRINLDRIKNSQVLERLRNGIPDDQLQSPFARAGLLPYLFIALFFTGLVVAFQLTSFKFDMKGLRSPIQLFGGLMLCGFAARRYGHERIAGALESIGILGIFGLLSVFALTILSATNFPLADETLIRADAALGFSWMGMMRSLGDEPNLMGGLAWAYNSLQWQAISVIIILMILNKQNELWIFINGWVLGLTITGFLFPFFPAVAAINYYGLTAYPGVHSADFIDWMQGVRNGTIRVVDVASIRGIVTFPSFHATTAVLFAWGFWRVPIARWLFLALNGIMLVATIVIGGHYLVDILGGIAIAVLSLVISSFIVRNRSVAKPDDRRKSRRDAAAKTTYT